MVNYQVLAAHSIIRRMDGPIVLVNIDDGSGDPVPYLFYEQEGIADAAQAWRAYYDAYDTANVDPVWFTDWMEEREFSFVPFRTIEI